MTGRAPHRVLFVFNSMHVPGIPGHRLAGPVGRPTGGCRSTFISCCRCLALEHLGTGAQQQQRSRMGAGVDAEHTPGSRCWRLIVATPGPTTHLNETWPFPRPLQLTWAVHNCESVCSDMCGGMARVRCRAYAQPEADAGCALRQRTCAALGRCPIKSRRRVCWRCRVLSTSTGGVGSDGDCSGQW
jgi:hypothetical protein